MDLLPPVLDLSLLAAAVVLHEVGHGVVAYACGDATAAERGRLTLNPLRHIDPVGTILLPILLASSAWLAGTRPVLFGYAKPVPVDVRRMRNPRRDMALVALAGPAVNFLLAGVATLVFATVVGAEEGPAALVRRAAITSVSLNCVLGVLNLLPIPPLDGGRVLASVMPRSLVGLYAQVERVGMLVVLVLLMNTRVLPVLVSPVIHFFLRLGLPGSEGIG